MLLCCNENPIRHKKTKQQTATVMISLWFCSLLVLPELYCDWSLNNKHSWIFLAVDSFLSLTVKHSRLFYILIKYAGELTRKRYAFAAALVRNCWYCCCSLLRISWHPLRFFSASLMPVSFLFLKETKTKEGEKRHLTIPKAVFNKLASKTAECTLIYSSTKNK